MAVQASLKRVADRLSAAVRSFAASQGVDQDDIAMAGAFDTATEQISLLVGTDHKIDEAFWYSEIRKGIQAEFGEGSSIPFLVTLIIQRVGKLDEIYYALSLTENEIDLTELL